MATVLTLEAEARLTTAAAFCYRLLLEEPTAVAFWAYLTRVRLVSAAAEALLLLSAARVTDLLLALDEATFAATEACLATVLEVRALELASLVFD